MTDLLALGMDVEWPDQGAAEIVRDRVTADAGFGRLAGLAEWVAQVLAPTTTDTVEPASEARSSALPGARSPAPMFSSIHALVLGSQPVDSLTAEFAERAGVSLRSVGAAADDPGAALAAGAQLADAAVDAGADLLVLTLPALGSAAAVTVSVLTNTEPVKVLTRGVAATEPEAWMDLAVEVRDARRRCMPLRDEPDLLLAELGSSDLAAAAGIALRAAGRRTPVVLDGPAAAAAALLAYEAAPRAVRWWCTSDLGPDPLHELAVSRLGVHSILGLGTGLGTGLGAMLAVPILQAAARLAADALA